MKLGERVRHERTLRGWGLSTLAELSGVDVGTISALEMRKSERSKYAPALARAFAMRVDELMGAVPIDSLSAHTPAQSGGTLAHDMSLARNTLSLPKVTWEQLMSADLNEPFELEVIDDALGPDIFKGCTVRLDPGRPPQAGRPVLVKDGAGRFYLRDYQVAGAGRWQAVARQRGYAPLDSDADGLQLVAVMRGFDWP